MAEENTYTIGKTSKGVVITWVDELISIKQIMDAAKNEFPRVDRSKLVLRGLGSGKHTRKHSVIMYKK